MWNITLDTSRRLSRDGETVYELNKQTNKQTFNYLMTHWKNQKKKNKWMIDRMGFYWKELSAGYI
jgi:hypothetical protein